MITRLKRYLLGLRSLARINVALSRGSAGLTGRVVDDVDPATWEFSGFSQNGEDGILDLLLRKLRVRNRYFIEVGTSDGLENNTSWLSMVHRYSGIWVEGDPAAASHARDVFGPLNNGLRILSMFVDRENITSLLAESLHRDPDVFSLDVDGNDYHFVKALLDAGLRPKIVVVEYNAAMGPDKAITIPYDPSFRVQPRHGDSLYYGCSLSGWRSLFASAGYRFVTVEQNGVNAFFVDPRAFDGEFLERIRGRQFVDSYSHAREYGGTWSTQFPLIEERRFVAVPAQFA